MRTLVLFSVLLTAGSLTAQQSPDPAETFSACTGCHGLPDSQIGGDDLWIDRVATTACVQPPGPKSRALREALITYLREGEWTRPATETSARSMGEKEGRVRTGFGDVSVLLLPLSDHVSDHLAAPIRLVWSAGEKGGGTRTLRAGRYRLQGYRIGVTDDKGVRWELWGSGARGRTITVPPGGEVDLALDRRVHVKANAKPHRGKLNVSVQVLGDAKMGATIIRSEDRVPANYQIHLQAETVASGSLGYG
jgi:hypothetical protein